MHTPSEQGLEALTGTLFALAALLTFGRLAIRVMKAGRLQIDDYVQIVALSFLTVYTALILDYLPDVNDLQQGKVKLPQIQKITTYNITNNCIAKLVVVCCQATFLALYWSLFSVSKKFRIAWFVVASYNVVAFLASFLSTFWNCGDPTNITTPAACQGAYGIINSHRTLIMVCVFNVTVDLAIFCLPLFMLRPLAMKLSAKIGLATVFALGLLVIIFDILRTVYSIEPATAHNLLYVFVWDIAEPFVAVSVAAMPTYYTLAKKDPKSSRNYKDIDRSVSTTTNASEPALSKMSRDIEAAPRGSVLKRDELELEEIQRFAHM